MVPLVQGQGAQVGQQVAGGAVQVPPAHVRCHGHMILEEKHMDYGRAGCIVLLVQVHRAQTAKLDA